MRILNEQNIEITREEVDESLGRLVPDKFFKCHHEAIEGIEEISHMEPKEFFFTDGTSYVVVDASNDPHVNGMCYLSLNGEEEKQLYGTSAITVVDVPAVESVDAWDEYEDILRYVLYTENDIKNIQTQTKIESFVTTGPDRLDNLEINTDDLILLMAELIGA